MSQNKIAQFAEHAAERLPDTERRKQPLRNCVQTVLDLYFAELDGHKPADIYRMVINEVEAPLMERVMFYCGGNQSKAAAMLGINRTTLRKKLQHHGLDK